MKIDELSAEKFISSAYLEFGREVNLQRQIPHVMDGLKPSYRKILYTMYGFPDKLAKLVSIAGHTLSEYHGHGEKSLYPVLTQLEHKKIIDGDEGNYGYKPIYGFGCNAAAPRYIKAKLMPGYRALFSEVMDYVPTEVTDVGGRMAKYIPTPVPFMLMMGTKGLGIGCAVNLPEFSTKSILQAYKNNDPGLLESANECTLIHSKSSLIDIWNKGAGYVTYSYSIESASSPEGEKGFIISGDPYLFQPDLTGLKEWKDEGLIFFQDWSSNGVHKLFIGKSKRVVKITLPEIKKTILPSLSKRIKYSLNVSDGDKVFRISMKDWVHTTYTNYIGLMYAKKSDKLDKVKHAQKVLDAIRPVTKVILANPKTSVDDIAKSTGIKVSIVKEVLRKPLSRLLNSDFESEQSRINADKKLWESYSPENTIIKLTKSIQ